MKLAPQLALVLRHLINDHGPATIANAFGLTSEAVATVLARHRAGRRLQVRLQRCRLDHDARRPDVREVPVRVIYVAGAYTAATPWLIEQNVRRAESIGYLIAQAGAVPLIPHANMRWQHLTAELTTDWWYAATRELLNRCDAVVMVPGWEASNGARYERERAIETGKLVFTSINELSAWLPPDGAR